ncbi:MAG: hypothetical protein G01um101430_512 [Parcubacteria group bacterium Gr01-1014_30]|nr:MAG: hypothetical protein G01um101430_512 [Parcubacteria group bacterium Gr01-1014_30]
MIRAIWGLAWFKTILGILWLILFIWALVDILGSKKDVATKIIWIVVCLILPVLGVIIYVIFGSGNKDTNTPTPPSAPPTSQ